MKKLNKIIQKYDDVLALILIVALFLLVVFLTGCRNPLIESSKLFLDTAGNEYLEYVDKDVNLDERAKNARRENLYWFKRLVEEAEK